MSTCGVSSFYVYHTVEDYSSYCGIGGRASFKDIPNGFGVFKSLLGMMEYYTETGSPV